MKHQSRILAYALAMVLAATLGAQAPDGPTHPTTLPASSDLELSRFADTIPGFGGLYYDAEGRPNLFLTEPAMAKSLQLGSDVRVHRGTYDFRQLVEWKRALRPLLTHPGAIFVDADERRNRVVFGIAPGFDRMKLRLAVMRLGVPSPAVIFQEMEPFSAYKKTIQEEFTKVPGGVRITGDSQCTLGFNANLGEVKGFVTNSHCSSIFGGLDSTEYFQHDATGGRRIGEEHADASFFTGGNCPSGFSCRYSDAAFVRYDDPASDRKFAKIARTKSSGQTYGSVVIDPNKPRFTVVGKRTFPNAGETLHKIGQSSGWTKGDVFYTCADTAAPGTTGQLLLCQFYMDSAADPGDSGAPVFSRNGPDVKIVGIVWGGNIDLSVASPMSNIETELGSLAVK